MLYIGVRLFPAYVIECPRYLPHDVSYLVLVYGTTLLSIRCVFGSLGGKLYIVVVSLPVRKVLFIGPHLLWYSELLRTFSSLVNKYVA